MATYVIGDVQGCWAALQALLERIRFAPGHDRLWFVGDLVNRGPDSLAVLRYVKALGPAATVVLGNHDLYLLARARAGVDKAKYDTLDAVLGADDREELLDWLAARPLLHRAGEYCMVHAGLLPQWSVAQAAELAHEVESVLRGEHQRDFLTHMMGNTPKSWSDDLRGWARLRVVVNALTRLRFCSADGQLEFKTKGVPECAPPGLFPWYAVPHRASGKAVLLFGHWSALGLRVEPRLLSLDSGCIWGGALSAVRLEDREVFQVFSKAGGDPIPVSAS